MSPLWIGRHSVIMRMSVVEGTKCSLLQSNRMNAKQRQCEMGEIKFWLKTGVFHSHSSLNLTLILLSDNRLSFV